MDFRTKKLNLAPVDNKYKTNCLMVDKVDFRTKKLNLDPIDNKYKMDAHTYSS